MTPFVADPDFTLYCGDALDVLRSLPDGSVDCCVTSPPYWGLRDYGTGAWSGGEPSHGHVRPSPGVWPASCVCGAKYSDPQIGLESSPAAYVSGVVAVFREVRRVLSDEGTLWLNLGDSYASDPGKGGSGTPNGRNGRGENYGRPGLVPGEGGNQSGARNRDGTPSGHGLKAKDLVGIPWRVAFALQADGWYLRSDIIWSKPNPMPESVTDRPTKAHEYVFLLSKGPRYFFDQEAVREPHSPDTRTVTQVVGGKGSIQHRDGERWPNGGRNVRSVWEIATQPYSEAHFATYPEELVRRCISAGTSERGKCPECGAPWVRDVEKRSDEREFARDQPSDASSARRADGSRLTSGTGHRTLNGTTPSYRPPEVTTNGWRPTCECSETPAGQEALPLHGLPGAASDGAGTRADHMPVVQGGSRAAPALAPIPCTVLDPFMGSGTTALVARRHGRKSIGIELNPEYAAMCAKRLQQLSLLGDAA